MKENSLDNIPIYENAESRGLSVDVKIDRFHYFVYFYFLRSTTAWYINGHVYVFLEREKNTRKSFTI